MNYCLKESRDRERERGEGIDLNTPREMLAMKATKASLNDLP